MHITIPFRPQFQDVLLAGRKTCTARTKYLGQPGDTFEAFGAVFQVESVQEVFLYEVADLWKEEGCVSEEHFKSVWAEIHPQRGYDDWQRVKLHRFRMIGLA